MAYTRYAEMLNKMINSGDLTIAEAEAELASPICDAASREILAGWLMERRDQGPGWRAGDPVRLPDGRVVAYADECEAMQYPNRFEQSGDETWSRKADYDGEDF